MKEIKLNHDKIALVDDCDYWFLNSVKWYAHNIKGKWYAVRGVRQQQSEGYPKGKNIRLSMHRVIMFVNDRNTHVDHRDHDTLNNQSYNLRIATPTQNNWNKKSFGKTSNYLGVHFRRIVNISKKDGREIFYDYWVACMTIRPDGRYLPKLFKSEIEAAKAYNEAALKRYGEFANLNKV